MLLGNVNTFILPKSGTNSGKAYEKPVHIEEREKPMKFLFLLFN